MVTSKIKRTVRFHEIRMLMGDRSPVNQEQWHTIFTETHSRFSKVKSPDRTIIRNGIEYVGWASNDANTTEDYFIIGRRRSPADNPGVEDGATLPTPLELEEGLLLVEPVYVISVKDTPYVVTIGSSGCPRSGAITDWITRKGGYIDQDLEVSIVPVLRRDAMNRLQRAKAATALTVKVSAASIDSSHSSRLSQALRASKGLIEDDGTISLSISLGRHKKNRDSEFALLDDVQELAGLSAANTAQARVLVPEGDKMVTEMIDFIKDKLTDQVTLDGDPNEPPSHATMIRAMLEAVSKHRSQLP